MDGCSLSTFTLLYSTLGRAAAVLLQSHPAVLYSCTRPPQDTHRSSEETELKIHLLRASDGLSTVLQARHIPVLTLLPLPLEEGEVCHLIERPEAS